MNVYILQYLIVGFFLVSLVVWAVTFAGNKPDGTPYMKETKEKFQALNFFQQLILLLLIGLIWPYVAVMAIFAKK